MIVSTQTNAKGKTTTMTYDQLGRMLSKTDETGTAEWTYINEPFAKGVGKLATMVGAPDPKLNGTCAVPGKPEPVTQRAVRSFAYNQFGDLETTSECADGEVFETSTTYDHLWRQERVKYPKIGDKDFSTTYHYTDLGYLHYVSDGTDDKPYWVAKAMNAGGQLTQESTRNGVTTVADRNPSTGWLLGSSVTNSNGAAIQGLQFAFDEAGNLLKRVRIGTEQLPVAQEAFGYDPLDRVTSSQLTIPQTGIDRSETFRYDQMGNLTQKGNRGYTYTGSGCTGGPHAVCQVDGGPMYGYDGNGNMISGNGRNVTYTPGNKVSRIVGSVVNGQVPTVDFAYGADGHRVLQLVGTDGVGESERTIYVGLGATGKSIYERTTKGTDIEHVQFIYAAGVHGGNAFAVRVTKTEKPSGQTMHAFASNAADQSDAKLRYQHFDHLGSITATTDDDGEVVGPASGNYENASLMAYDTWGARRDPGGQATATFSLQPGHREFTGHEAIPQVGLVNMNGRVYDPELGRFLTPDPNVQFLANLQSYNRYSYALNNPLRYTDPTGYFLGGWFDTGVNLFIAAAAVGCGVSGGAGCVLAFTLAATAYNVSSMAYAGASFDQIARSMAIGLAAGNAFGAAAGGVFGQSLAGMMIGGAVSGAATNAFTTWAMGGSISAKSLLLSASTAAVTSAFAWYRGQVAAVSARSAQEQAWEQQGGGEVAGYSERNSITREQAEEVRKTLKWQAAQNGQVTTRDVDGVPLNVWGGTEEQRASAMEAAVADLRTQRGGDMLKTLQGRVERQWYCLYMCGETKPFDIILAPGAGAVGGLNSNYVVIGTDLIGSYDARVLPGERIGWGRVLAHEFGHAILGIANETVNIGANENLIMQQQGDPQKRIAY